MNFLIHRWLSLDSQSLRTQFGIGLLLFFAVPGLALWYFMGVSGGTQQVSATWIVLFMLFVMILALAGFFLMRRGSVQVEALRGQLESVVKSELNSTMTDGALTVASDIESINACMRVIVGELRTHIQDIESEKAELNEQLIQAQKAEGLGTMATGVAHDFNNLIAAVMGNAGIVISSLPPDAPARENALQIQATAYQAVELTNKIALYSGHCRFDGVPVKLSTLVEESRRTIDELVYRGVRVEYHLDDGMPLICGDRQQLQLLLHGLVQNASDAIICRSGTVIVSTGMMLCDGATMRKMVLDENLPEGRYAYLEVADTGVGITSDVRQRMFDPFYSSKIRGQGLGLPVVLGVARSHSGGLIVESVPEHGSVFRVLFPCPSALDQ